MGICEIRMGELRLPALPPRWLAFCGFILFVSSTNYFGRVGGFH